MGDFVGGGLRPQDPSEWTVEEVGEWVGELGFEQYRETFVHNDVFGLVLLRLDKDTLAELVPSVGHRVELLQAINRLRGPKSPRHVGEGVVNGFSGFASKVYGGLSHLVNDPMDGASKDGAAGFLKGLGMGLKEAIQQPAEGVALLTHQLGTGLMKTPDAFFGREQGVTEELPSSSTTEGQIELAKPAFLQQQPASKPAHLGEGLMLGLRSFGSGLYDGVTGLVTEPMKAARSHSHDPPDVARTAIAKGVAKGLAGVVCKPVGGTFELATNTMNGLLATPQAIAAAAKDGPTLMDTPTIRRLASMKLPTPEEVIRRLNRSQEPRSVGNAIEEVAHRQTSLPPSSGVP